MKWWAAALALSAACSATSNINGGPDGGAMDAAVAPDAAPPPPADLAPAPAATFLLTLDAGAYPPTPSHPSALVYVPSGFDATPPLSFIVYIHGFDNCVENIVRDAGQSCDPDGGTPVRFAYSLAAQLEASGKNAILLCPEIAFDQATGNPGTLGTAGGFRALLGETLTDLSPRIGARTIADVGTIVVASHSGGYQAAAAIAIRGGVPVSELYLLDSLYGNTTDFDNWVMQDLSSLAGSPPARRFADVYTTGGGTLANSQAMADRAATWVPADGGTLVDDRTTATWPDATYLHGLLFKHSGLTHDGVPTYYFGKLVSSSSLPAK
jgi:hypothetical protein